MKLFRARETVTTAIAIIELSPVGEAFSESSKLVIVRIGLPLVVEAVHYR